MSLSASSEPIPRATEDRRRGRRIAFVVLALCAAPTVAAWLAYFVWQPQSRLNYGELVGAQLLADPRLSDMDGKPFRLSQLRGKWVILQVDSGSCGEPCQRNLAYMRQLRIGQGKDMDRIERVWLLTDHVAPGAGLLREFEGTRVARAAGSAILARFPPAPGASDHIYLIDPLGNLMLRFPSDPDPRRMSNDLARLLRASRIG
jgi:hypothetical protein